MKHLPQISEAEYEIMKVIWKEAPINTNEVTKQLVQTTDWNPKTIQTLLKRLTQKGRSPTPRRDASLSTLPLYRRKTI